MDSHHACIWSQTTPKKKEGMLHILKKKEKKRKNLKYAVCIIGKIENIYKSFAFPHIKIVIPNPLNDTALDSIL